MIEEFEYAYMKKYWNIQLFQWCNYFENGNYDLSLIDNEMFNIVHKYYCLIKPIDRRSKIAYLQIKKDLVDKNPLVSELRNRIDNQENYNKSIPPQLEENRYNYLLELSSRMKSDVVKLMNIRNKLSKEVGYSSYPELVFKTEEINKEMLVNLLNSFVEENINKVLKLIAKYNIKWKSWFSDLNKISVPMLDLNPVELINQFIDKLGFNCIKEKIQINYMEHEFSGVASEISPKNIKIVAAPIHSLSDLTGLFHELGHAISYYFNEEKGLYRILPASYDEAMAVVMEHLAPQILFDEFIKEKISEIQVLEYTRCAISSLYEFELWEKPEQAEELYIKHYSRLGLNINNPSIWACDTFRSIDPVYIHNYVIGAVLSKYLNKYLVQNYRYDYLEWGKWLINNIYKDGRKRIFTEKISEVYAFK
ncbi:hypothetical protein HMPREF1982_03435 [Clostridiales bacterium oral taxon 876 str. F0540]|nr:hypothetical protein HMPREF1982_03435 [Clostridiales bacterium oral taxon 876 str. F0540]